MDTFFCSWTKIEKFFIYLVSQRHFYQSEQPDPGAIRFCSHPTFYYLCRKSTPLMEKTTRRLPIVERDEWLQPAEAQLNLRHERYADKMADIGRSAGSLVDYANGYRYFGWQRDELARRMVAARVAARSARRLRLRRLQQLAAHRDPHAPRPPWGLERLLPRSDVPRPAAARLALQTPRSWRQRLAGPHSGLRDARRAGRGDQKLHGAVLGAGAVRLAGRRLRHFENREPAHLRSTRGHGPGAEGVGTYREFTEKIFPIIKKDGYNAVQLMAVAEHPYYGSFGYHVSSFFAPSSRCGTPEELKELMRRAHELGLGVIMDLVHAHYVKNLNEGINYLDGTITTTPYPVGGRTALLGFQTRSSITARNRCGIFCSRTSNTGSTSFTSTAIGSTE